MSKNIIICCDGTNNQLEGDITNVVRLYQVVQKDAGQVAYYDPGVGTMADPVERSWLGKRWSMVEGLAFGAGLEEDVREACRYLMQTYEEGDKVFLFGFSRGAFTARVLAGMLHGVGLLHAGAENLLPYMWRYYLAMKDEISEETKALRRSFTRECPVHFLGLWDTVGSVGMYGNNQAFPFTWKNDSVHIVRHAVSLDERRGGFRSNVFLQDETPLPELNGRWRVMNVWFPGVHSDVGGGYLFPLESGLAMVAFAWMLHEAKAAGLCVDDAKAGALLAACAPDPLGKKHESLECYWHLVECLPVRRYDFATKTKKWRWPWQNWRVRTMVQKPIIHQSVLDRKAGDSTYCPNNFPTGPYTIEP